MVLQMPGITPFHFTVTETFQIEGLGLVLSPFFPLNRYHFSRREHVRVETPDGGLFETEVDFQVPCVQPQPDVLQAMCVIRGVEKAEVPIGSRVVLVNVSAQGGCPGRVGRNPRT